MKRTFIAYGIISAVFTVFHAAFWWIFDWPAQLKYMTFDHRSLMQTFDFCMLPLFVFFTYIYFFLRDEIITTRLGRSVLLMNAGIYYFRGISELLFGDITLGESQFFLVLTLLMGIYFTWPVFKTTRAAVINKAELEPEELAHKK